MKVCLEDVKKEWISEGSLFYLFYFFSSFEVPVTCRTKDTATVTCFIGEPLQNKNHRGPLIVKAGVASVLTLLGL